MITLRTIALAAALLPIAGTAALQAADRPSLRGDVVASRDVLTIGDLVQDAPPSIAATPVFRAPSLGQTGTIQTKRILDTTSALGMEVETGGRLQITVMRAARRVGSAEIETALKRALETQAGLDGRSTGIAFEGTPPALLLAPDVVGEVTASELVYDRRSRRLSATVWIGPSPTERKAAVRVAGTATELVEVAVLGRGLERGETVKPGDVTVERRARDGVPPETLLDGAPLPGRVARRSLSAGSLVRSGDLARPDLIGRGDMVSVVYEAPGMNLSMRMKATESGALGDTVTVVNPGSKKTLQGVVIGPGRISVNAGSTGRVVASASLPVQP